MGSSLPSLAPQTPLRRVSLQAVPLAAFGGGLFGEIGAVGGALVLVFLVLSLAFHEAAHAWTAWKCGDSTARDMGRMTLNPVPHIDPFMTLLLPSLLMMVGPFVFGGAKPVPVLFHRLRHPWRDMMLVAIAGPLSNVLLAVLFALVYKVSLQYGVYDSEQLLPRVMWYAMYFNLILAIFNMIPLPPLDGSRVLAWALPESLRPGYVGLERFGFMLILLLVFSGAIRPIFAATYPPLLGAVNFVVTAGGLW